MLSTRVQNDLDLSKYMLTLPSKMTKAHNILLTTKISEIIKHETTHTRKSTVDDKTIKVIWHFPQNFLISEIYKLVSGSDRKINEDVSK